MPEIVLKEDVNPERGWVKGVTVDWVRPTITAMSEHRGNTDWYELSSAMAARHRRQALNRGRPKKAKADGIQG